MHFRLFNIPVQIEPSFWLFLLFFTDIYRDFSIESGILGIVLILSLLVHEFGHALTAAYFGASPTVTLEAFGGNARYDAIRITPKQEFLVTLNGPLLESLLIFLSYFLLESRIFVGSYYTLYALKVTMHLNILWCLLNLIPIAPLDGGHLLRNFLERKFGPRGYRVSVILGILCTLCVAPYLFYQNLIFFAILLLFFGFQNFQLLQQIRSTS